jgi:hypothetical protein
MKSAELAASGKGSRRPVAEWVFARAAHDERRVTIRRGVRVKELVAGPSAVPGTPHVAGIRIVDGDELRADLVIDAGGRQSRSPDWLVALGARSPYEEEEDSGFVLLHARRGTRPRSPTIVRGSPRWKQIGTDASCRRRPTSGTISASPS